MPRKELKLLTITHSDDEELFLSTVGDVLKDEGFQLPTSQASEAQEAAASLLQWCAQADNKAEVSLFSSALLQHLRRCLPTEPNRESMWRHFHAFRSSKDHFICTL